MSRAVVFNDYGDPDVLEVVEVAVPDPGPGEVRVAVRAAGVQPFDCLFRSGRAAAYMPATFPQRLGNELAGTIDAIGAGVSDWSVGDEVLGWAVLASYADHAVVGRDQLVAKPTEMPWAEAGAFSASGQTAATALRELGVGAGDTLLIHAAAGGVGSVAVQIARSRGATVVGTASPRNHDFLRELGAVPVAYGDGVADRIRAAAPDSVDAALDAVGTEEALRTSVELVADPSRVGTIAFSPLAQQLGVRRLTTERSVAQLGELVDLYRRGELHVVADRVFPLSAAAEAHREVEKGHGRGKVVLTMDDDNKETR